VISLDDQRLRVCSLTAIVCCHVALAVELFASPPLRALLCIRVTACRT
jgi:hypothetical protein